MVPIAGENGKRWHNIHAGRTVMRHAMQVFSYSALLFACPLRLDQPPSVALPTLFANIAEPASLLSAGQDWLNMINILDQAAL